VALVSDTIFTLLLLASGGFAATTFGFAVAWIRARERAIRAEQRAAPASDGDARFDRLEHAIEAMAVEVERMSEGQRFVSKVLAERVGQERDAGARAARVDTPH
jgi:hypothetical protein